MSRQHGNLQKYQNSNPLQQALIQRFLTRVGTLLSGLEIRTALDAGCAEGFVSAHLREHELAEAAFVGVDLDWAALQRGRTFSPFMQRAYSDVLRLPFGDAQFDLVLSTEVLEHLLDPRLALREFKRVSRRYVLLSVPHEPWFRGLNFLRGKHLRRWGNDPEHVNNWSGRQFADLVAEEMEVLATMGAFPWWVVLGQVRNLDETTERCN